MAVIWTVDQQLVLWLQWQGVAQSYFYYVIYYSFVLEIFSLAQTYRYEQVLWNINYA